MQAFTKRRSSPGIRSVSENHALGAKQLLPAASNLSHAGYGIEHENELAANVIFTLHDILVGLRASDSPQDLVVEAQKYVDAYTARRNESDHKE